MQYSYDSLILKEHKRRLNIKNANLSFETKHRLDINSIVNNFKIVIEDNLNLNSLLNISSSLFDGNGRNEVWKNLDSECNDYQKIFRSNKIIQEISKTNYEKITFDKEEIQNLKLNISNNQCEQRRLNNLKIDIDFNQLNNKKMKSFNNKIKQIFKSKSSDNIKRNNSSYLTIKGDSKIFIEENNNDMKFIKEREESPQYNKANNSFIYFKNTKINKIYATELFKEENFFDFTDNENIFFIDDENIYKNKEISNKNLDLFEYNQDIFYQSNNKNNYFENLDYLYTNDICYDSNTKY